MIAIEKIILIVIFLIILVVCIYLIVSNIMPSGEQIDIQNRIRDCCLLYRANNCPTDLNLNPIICNGSYLQDMIAEVPMDVYQLKALCNCQG